MDAVAHPDQAVLGAIAVAGAGAVVRDLELVLDLANDHSCPRRPRRG